MQGTFPGLDHRSSGALSQVSTYCEAQSSARMCLVAPTPGLFFSFFFLRVCLCACCCNRPQKESGGSTSNKEGKVICEIDKWLGVRGMQFGVLGVLGHVLFLCAGGGAGAVWRAARGAAGCWRWQQAPFMRD